MDTSPRRGARLSTVHTALATLRLAGMSPLFSQSMRCPQGCSALPEEPREPHGSDKMAGPGLSISNETSTRPEQQNGCGTGGCDRGDLTHPGVAEVVVVAGAECH